MTDVMVFMLAWMAFSLLALSQSRHWEAVTGHKRKPHRKTVRIRLVAAFLSAMSLFFALLGNESGFAALIWVLAQCTAAFLVALLITYSPGVFRYLAMVLQLIGRRM